MRGGSTGTQRPLSRAATHRFVAIPSFWSGTAAETATIAGFEVGLPLRIGALVIFRNPDFFHWFTDEMKRTVRRFIIYGQYSPEESSRTGLTYRRGRRLYMRIGKSIFGNLLFFVSLMRNHLFGLQCPNRTTSYPELYLPE